MTNIDGLIVVEGQSDIDFLSSFLNANFYKVNGSAISEDDLNFLLEVSKKEKIIVLTDPDFPGMQIRTKINEKIPNCYNAFVRKEVSIKHHKVGVAESTKEEVLNALKNCVVYKKTTVNTISINDLYELGLVGKNNSGELREKLSDKLHLGFNNSKQLLFKLNSLGYNKETIKEELDCVNG